MPEPKRRKCMCCKTLFRPDPRTAFHQRYCSGEDCQVASKRASQRCWAAKPANRDHFHGPVHVDRVRAWREAHPGYWRKTPRLKRCTLQEECEAQAPDFKPDKAKNAACTLREEIFSQPAFYVGLISQTIGSTLQEEIAESIRLLQTRGQDILGRPPGNETVHNGKIAS